MIKKIELPIPVLKYPHWRVNFRPGIYTHNLIPSLGKCFEIIEKTKLSLRGWDYPHLSRRNSERGQGANWVASWSEFGGHNEYWRFYQSGQFIHLYSILENLRQGWRTEIEKTMRSHLSHMNVDWTKIPGFISIINFIYQVTEIYEFAARLCEAQIYTGKVNIKIELKNIKGFILAAPWERMWYEYYVTNESILGTSNAYESDVLIANSHDEAINTIVWFFERFGWFSPSIDIIRQDQEKLLKGNI